MQPQDRMDDERLKALETWAGEQLGRKVEAEPVSMDASFRRYFRFRVPGRTLIGMDAPPEKEDSEPFVRVSRLFSEAGVHVPEVVAGDLEQGFLLLTDLGEHTWLDILDEDNADERFPRAIEALLRIQQASRPGVLPPYDGELLRRELALFPEWYLERHLGLTLDNELRRLLEKVFDLLVDAALAQGRVWVHRDFMPRNLMDSDPDPGVIDFQDAVYGPVSYDPVCLFRDAFISWPEERVQGWLEQYWQGARQLGLPVPETFEAFLRDCDLMGAQRHLKVIGIFARICHRDGKPKYLDDVPRFFGYLRGAANRQPALAPLGELLDRVGAP